MLDENHIGKAFQSPLMKETLFNCGSEHKSTMTIVRCTVFWISAQCNFQRREDGSQNTSRKSCIPKDNITDDELLKLKDMPVVILWNRVRVKVIYLLIAETWLKFVRRFCNNNKSERNVHQHYQNKFLLASHFKAETH